MRISHSRRFVFLSNPKCGSTSIRALLDPVSDIKGELHPTHPLYMKHINACALKSYFEDEDFAGISVAPWDEYYKFTTVRNPFKKMVSYYFFLRPDKEYRSFDHGEYDETSEFSHGFNTWLEYIMDGRGLPAYEYFCCDHDSKELLLDDVFKIEEIDQVLLPVLLDKCGLKADFVPHLQPDLKSPDESKHINWNGDPYSLYNNKSREIMELIYEKDIELFNYKFGE